MRYEVRPLVAWTDPETYPRRGTHIFKASWRDTLVLLGEEIERVGGEPPVVFQIDVQEGDIRLDGMLRANARVGHPGVVVSFQSQYGPLRYATDAHEKQYGVGMEGWQANIRAIALALVALRAVDRYGVTRRGEQYTGWKALPAGGHTVGRFASPDEALRWMLAQAEGGSAAKPRDLYRVLAKRMHPDAGGDPADWSSLDAARKLLDGAGML